MTIGPRLERFLVAGFVLSLLGGAVFVLSFIEIPQANRDVVFQLVGGVNALAGMVVAAYFRSTDRSHVVVDNQPSEPVPTRPLDYPEPTFGKE